MADTLEELCGKMSLTDGEKNGIQVMTKGEVVNIKAMEGGIAWWGKYGLRRMSTRNHSNRSCPVCGELSAE